MVAPLLRLLEWAEHLGGRYGCLRWAGARRLRQLRHQALGVQTRKLIGLQRFPPARPSVRPPGPRRQTLPDTPRVRPQGHRLCGLCGSDTVIAAPTAHSVLGRNGVRAPEASVSPWLTYGTSSGTTSSPCAMPWSPRWTACPSTTYAARSGRPAPTCSGWSSTSPGSSAAISSNASACTSAVVLPLVRRRIRVGQRRHVGEEPEESRDYYLWPLPQTCGRRAMPRSATLSLDAPADGHLVGGGAGADDPSGHLLVRVVAETTQHAGHADVLLRRAHRRPHGERPAVRRRAGGRTPCAAPSRGRHVLVRVVRSSVPPQAYDPGRAQRVLCPARVRSGWFRWGSVVPGTEVSVVHDDSSRASG